MDVTSYATYELIGPYDILLRIYLLPNQEPLFREELSEHLDLSTKQCFRVEDVSRHWVWASRSNETGPIQKPSKEVLGQRYPRSELALLSDQENASDERQQLITRYAALDLVRESARELGIKVVMTIGFTSTPSDAVRGRLAKKIAEMLDSADPTVHERSLYVGEAEQRELFLIMCRVDYREFHRLRERLIDPLGEIVGTASGRTTTYPVLSDDFLCFSEHVAVAAPTPVDAYALLEGHESANFEVKGSLLAALDPWLREGKSLQESPNVPEQGVLKAVAGLLNSGGGTVVVGALEEERYLKYPEAMTRLGQFPKLGKHVIVGLVDPTFTEFGWDLWERKLRTLMQSKIDSPPGVLVQTRSEEIAGQPVCVIEADEPREDDAFYVRLSRDRVVFYARIGTSVIELRGSEIEQHRDQMRQHRRARWKKR